MHGRGRVWVRRPGFEIDTTNRNRLHAIIYWWGATSDDESIGWSIHFGNGNSDPVWFVDLPRAQAGTLLHRILRRWAK